MENITSFFSNPTALIGAAIGVIVFIVLAFFGITRKHLKQDTTNTVKPVVKPAAVLGYKCRCGIVFSTLKEEQEHAKPLAKTEKGKHGFAGREQITQGQVVVAGQQPGVESVLNTGNYKCVCIRKIEGRKFLDFTTIPQPVGELYQGDTSLPTSGGMYTVKEEASGKVVDFDPRMIRVADDKTPDYAFSATHWDDVLSFWIAEKRWWQSITNWWVAAFIFIDFLALLVFFGG